MAAVKPTHLLQLPRDVWLNVVERCGPREKWALFLTCQFARCLVLEVAQQISGSLQPDELHNEPRPPLLLRGLDECWLETVKLQLKDISLSSLQQHADQMRGIKHLKLAMLKTDNPRVSTLRTLGQGLQQQPVSDPAMKLETALSQLRSLSITECCNPDVPGLLGALATSCTQLTHLELCLRRWPGSNKDYIHELLRALDPLSSVNAFPALQSLVIAEFLALETPEALELLTSHPVARTRMTSLRLTQVLPAEAAVRLRNLRQLRMDTYVSVSEVQALQCLFCLTSLTVMGLRAKKEDLVLQPADLPSRLQVLRMKILDLYWFQHWLPALAAVPRLEVGYVSTHDMCAEGMILHAQLSASKDAAAALMHGRRLASNESQLGGYSRDQESGESPVCLRYLHIWAMEAVQPLLSQLPFIELVAESPETSTFLALGATTTKLRLVFLMDDGSYGPGRLRTLSGWVELLDAMPRVRTVQMTFDDGTVDCSGKEQTRFPVYRKGSSLCGFEPGVEAVLTSAIKACEQKDRILELCGPKGWLTFEEYQGLVNRSHIIRVAEIYRGSE